MQFVYAAADEDVAVMEPKETLILELALSLYVMHNPDSNIATRMMVDVSRANEERDARIAESAAPTQS